MKKTIKTILATSLICTLPVGVFALDDDHDGHENKISSEYIKTAGVNLKFEGEVQRKPKTGFNGIWKISGKEVIVDDKTIIFMEDRIRLSDEVEILAKRENGKIKAIILEQE